MKRPVRAIIVAYRGADQLDSCLTALRDVVPVTGCRQLELSDVRAVALGQGAEYLDTGRNVGFGAGVNTALRRMSADSPADVLLVNPDAILTAPNFRVLVEYIHEPGHERLAAVSPRLVSPDGAAQRVVWPFPSPLRAWGDAIGIGRWVPPGDTFVIGAVLLLRWEAVREVGAFDERFFLYCEETDWLRRASGAGWISSVCPSAVAVHAGAGTSADPQRREALFHAGQETYIRKWYGRGGWWIYRSAACLGATVRAVVFGGERRAAAVQRALLYARGPRRCAAALAYDDTP